MFESTTKIHLCADSKDLNCPICYCAYGLEENQPISINCGHTICSICFERVSKCPFCKVRFHKRIQKHQKSIFISELIANSSKINTCKEHSEICQGFCLQDKTFVCFDCVMKKHHGHKIISIKEINEKAEKARAGLQKARKTKDLKQTELKSSLEAESKRQKRQLDEIIDQEISQLSMLKKKLYKEVDLRIITEKENYDHRLLSENLSKYCQNTENMLVNWNKSQEVNLAVQILEAPFEEETQGIRNYENQVNLFKTEITKKHLQSMSQTLKSLNSICHSSAKFQKLFAPNKKIDITQHFPQVELDYLINVFNEYNLTASQKSGYIEIKVNNTTSFMPKFDPSQFTCSLQKISVNCLDILPSISLATISQILQNTQALKDVTLQLQKINNSDLTVLENLIINLKTLEKFNVQMNLNDISRFDISGFTKNLISLKNLFSLEVQRKNSHTSISFQLVHSSIPVLPLATLHEISLDLECIPEVSGTLHTLKSSQVKSLKVLRLSLGKTECSPQVLQDVCETLRLHNDLEELIITCEELSDSSSSELSKILIASTQKKKLEIFVNKALVRENPTKFLPKSHATLQDLEEFTFKIKYPQHPVISESYIGLIDFLSSMKALKKLCLQFDGITTLFSSNQRFFAEITKLKMLISLEIEHIDRYGIHPSEQRVFENILKRLPNSINKKIVFKKPEFQYEDFDDDSEYSRYSDEENDYDDEEIIYD